MLHASKSQSSPALWEKLVSAIVSAFIFGVVAWLVVRNEPFRDPNLVVILRLVLSVSAAVLGATIPGFLRLDWRAKGLVIRSGGALTLFLVSFMWSPTVLQTPPERVQPPLTSNEVSTLHAQGFTFAAQIRSGFGPAAASAYKAALEPIAKKVWADGRYEQQAPHDSALIYRLYAATLVLERPSDGNIVRVAQSALPWMTKAGLLDDRAGDRGALEEAVSFFGQVAQGKIENVELSQMLKHQFRLAMPGAKSEEIDRHVQATLRIVIGLVAPSQGGPSAKDDANFLARHKLGKASIGQVMEVMRITLQGKFPGVDVGGQPIFGPLPNGNTLVRYSFKTDTATLVYEWEVNQSKALTTPMNAATRELMTLRVPQ